MILERTQCKYSPEHPFCEVDMRLRYDNKFLGIIQLVFDRWKLRRSLLLSLSVPTGTDHAGIILQKLFCKKIKYKRRTCYHPLLNSVTKYTNEVICFAIKFEQ